MTIQTNPGSNNNNHSNSDINNSKGNRKIAIVTGSSEGIGFSIASSFANSGDYKGVVVNSRKLDQAQKAAEEIKKEITNNQDIEIIPIQADVSKEEECINLIKKTIEHFGRIDVLVNNAGIQKMCQLKKLL